MVISMAHLFFNCPNKPFYHPRGLRMVAPPLDVVVRRHLKHFNHSKQFKKDMTRYSLDHKELEVMLRSYITNCAVTYAW